jgi:hypothetical protein
MDVNDAVEKTKDQGWLKEVAATAGLFVLFIVIGGSWVGLGFLPAGLPREIVTVGLAVAFVFVFFWLLGKRLVRLFAGRGSYTLEAILAGVNVLLLLCAFAGLYAQYGLADTTGGGEKITYQYTDALYYSVVTFTTLGYGDIQPRGMSRILACIETFVGYIVLGLLASTATSFIQATAKQRKDNEADHVAPVEA